MAAQDGGSGGRLDRVVLAELLDRFHAVIGDAAKAARPGGGGPDRFSQWTAAEQGEGPPLYAVVDMLGPLPPDAVAALAVAIAAELARIHAIGTLHRRLTPSNVLLPESGPRLVYSGVPHTVDGATITDLDGSPLVLGYLTPEQVLGQPVGPETDVFALGGVLAFAASGSPPFGSDEPLSVLYRIVNEEPALDAVPDSLRGLVKACLSKLPAQRPTLQTLTARATGVLNLYFRGWLQWSGMLGTAAFWRSALGHALAAKLVAVVTMIAVSATHDFLLGPAAGRAAPGSPRAIVLRRRAALLARVNAFVGVIVVIAAVRLARGG